MGGPELQNVSATANLPALKNFKRNIRRHRSDNNIPPIHLLTQGIPVIWQPYQLRSGGTQFLLFDSGAGDENRILIFSTQEAIQLLATNDHWFMDGTFKLCPEIRYQIYTIHALINNQVFPFICTVIKQNRKYLHSFINGNMQCSPKCWEWPYWYFAGFWRSCHQCGSNSNVSSAGKH